MRVRNQQDFLAGLFFVVIAFGALWVGWSYPAGTAVRMNAGYFPRLVSALLGGLGLHILLRSLRFDGPQLEPFGLRPLVMIPAAVVVFGLGIQYFGFALAVFLIALFGSFADRHARLREALIASVVLTLAAIAIFIWGIGLPIPLWPDS